MSNPPVHLQAIVSALDSLGIAACIFGEDDTTLLWNRSFLRLFPEHDGHVHEGESYRENLRRFYECRLDPEEKHLMEEYIEAGVLRNREQQQPFVFDHRGLTLRVAGVQLPGVGRMRIWTEIGQAASALAGVRPEVDLEPFEQLADGIMMVDSGNRITWVNDRFIALYGLPAKTPLIDRSFEEVFALAWWGHEAEGAALRDAGVATLADNLRFAGAPFELPLPGGRWVRVVGQRGPQGVGYFSHVDFTRVKHQERDLLEKTAMLETTLSSISQGICMVGADGRLSTWNRKFREILDLPEDLLNSKPTLEEMTRFQLARGDFGEEAFKVQPHARSYVAAAGQGVIPDRYLRTTNEGRVIEVLTQTLASGGMVRTFSDVTDYVHAQEEIRRLNNELQDRVRQRTTELEGANRELDAFSYSIAHDLRQPLSSLDGFSTLLAALTPEDSNTPARHYVERIRAGVRQLSALTDGMLSLAYLSRKKLHWTDFDLADMTRELLDDMASREPGRRVAVDIQPELWASGEAMLMRQVLENLLANAWKFTVRNEDARISVGKLVNEEGETVFFVSDNGVGFDMAHAGKLFGSFQRLHSPNDFSGMGISLAITHRIIARHGGRIWARAAPGEGATFSFTLGREAPAPRTAG